MRVSPVVLALALVMASGSARADVVPPAPSSCPPGARPETGHEGPHCAPDLCDAKKCESGSTCETRQLCVEEISGPHRGGTARSRDVSSACVAGKCARGSCESLAVCVPRRSSSHCGCRLGPAEPAPWGALLLAVSLWASRRVLRRKIPRRPSGA